MRTAAHLAPFRIPALALFVVTLAAPQTPMAPDAPELASHDEPTTFQSKVNLVLVPVVVRDSSGRAVGDLRKEDFQLLDKGKPQVISRFSVEKSGGTSAASAPVAAVAIEPGEPAAQTAPPPGHFTAYVFDDVHLNFADLIRVRDAASHHLDTALQSTDRAAIFTTSGQTTLDFTDDRVQLHAALQKLRPRPITATSAQDCPDISFYLGDSIQNRNDSQALRAATLDALNCLNLDPSKPGSMQTAEQAARSGASRALNAGEQESRVSLIVLRQLIGRMSVMPGQRTILLISPGFFTPDDLRTEETEVMERAIHASVIINSLDARGLYTIDTLGDISKHSSSSVATLESQYVIASAAANADLLAELAHGTGGGFFQNSNDYAAGFKRLAAAPEFIYLLGFSPEKLKFDGSFHALKVRLTASGKFDLQVRRGYYAPKHASDAAATAKEEIDEALFSRDEVRDLPVDLKTQFFKSADLAASLSVLAQINLKQIRFRKAEGRNLDNLTIVTALFDRNGNFVKAIEKTVTMRLKDDTLNKTPAITLKTSFDVTPGSYVVRLVVRDAEHQLMAAESSAVEIPF